MNKTNALILISGSGTNMESIVKNTKDILDIRGVYSDREAFGIKRANSLGVTSKNLGRDIFDSLKPIIKKEEIELIILAGFLKIIDRDFLEDAPPILNIHPSLLPKYGGKGMYGINVHREVLKNKERFSGATVHLVDKTIDGGSIILRCMVYIGDLMDENSIQKRILPYEHMLYERAIRSYLKGRL